jgi:cardiolipin synthase A/B
VLLRSPTGKDNGTGHLPPRQKSRRRKGQLSVWGVARRLLWAWWLWAAIALVAAYTSNWGTAIPTALAAVFTYLVTPPGVSPAYGLESVVDVKSGDFLSTITGATGAPFIEGNRITIFNNGDEFYPVMLDAIHLAQYSITIEAYIYWAGEIGQRFAEAIAERAQRGVQVKILLDAVGSSTVGKEILRTLHESGCEVEWYNPVFWATIGRFNNRTHRKSLIVDGCVAFTGGAGIADHWMGHAQDSRHWRDIQIRLEGPAAASLQTGFAQNWMETTSELLSGPRYFPDVKSVGSLAVQTIMSSPESGSSAVRIMYYISVVCAQEKLFIANAYFLPDESGVDILIEAKKRGVDVKIMVPGVHNDMWLARYGSIHLYGKLLEAGVEIYEYLPTMLHQKIMVVDGTWMTVGTTNFDNRSFALHEESNVCLYDRRLAEELERTFRADLELCERINLESWRRRSLLTKIRGATALILKEQL